MESGKESMASTGAAIEGLGGAMGTIKQDAATSTQAIPVGAVPGVANPTNTLLLAHMRALITRIDILVESDAIKTKGYIEKYWPVATGILIALTRFLH